MINDKYGDLLRRMQTADEAGECLVPTSIAEGHRLREACRRGDLCSPVPHAYALPEQWSQKSFREQHAYKIRTLAKQHPDWVFCGPSAALIHGIAVSNRALEKVHVATSVRSHSRSSRMIKRQVVSGDATEYVHGIRVTSFVRTTFDCVRFAPFRDGLVVADSALHVSMMAKDAMLAAFDRLDGHLANKSRGIEIMQLADGLSESGGESVARAVMIEQGFMLPRLQVQIRDPVEEGHWFRVDFFWHLPSGDVAGELDGRVKYRDPNMRGNRDAVDVFADERLRESRITGAGVKVARFSYADVLNTQKFCSILSGFGVPNGFCVPPVARGW